MSKHGTIDPLASVTLQPADTVAMTVMSGDKEALFDIPIKQTIGELAVTPESTSPVYICWLVPVL